MWLLLDHHLLMSTLQQWLLLFWFKHSWLYSSMHHWSGLSCIVAELACFTEDNVLSASVLYRYFIFHLERQFNQIIGQNLLIACILTVAFDVACYGINFKIVIKFEIQYILWQCRKKASLFYLHGTYKSVWESCILMKLGMMKLVGN